MALLIGMSALAVAQEKTLVVALHQDLESTDPTVGGPIASVTYNMAIADHLVYMGDGGLEPWVIESWEATPEGVYTWHIQEGITFHDGTTLDAEAVKFNIERVIDPANNLRYGSYFAGLQNIEVVDPFTLSVDMGAFDVEFMERMINIAIASPTAVEELGDAFRDQPVGSGPFRFVSYTSGERVVVERNPNYWREGEPKVDRVIFRIIPEASVRLIELEAGQVHYAMDMAAADLEHASGTGLDVVTGPALGGLVIYFNLERLTDPNIRRAVNHAIDREAIMNIVFGDIGEVGYYAIPPASWAYDPDIPVYPHDVERANQLLDEAGWVRGNDGVRAKDGTRLEWDFVTSSIPSRLQASELIAAMLSDIGIQANLRVLDNTAHTAAARGGEHDITLMQWSGSTEDPWAGARDMHCNYSWNMAQACQPDVLDPLIEAGKQTVDRDERLTIYASYFTNVQEQSLSVTIGYVPSVFIARPEVDGVRIMGGRLLLTEATLDGN